MSASEIIVVYITLLLPILAACVVMAAVADYIVEPWLRRRDTRQQAGKR